MTYVDITSIKTICIFSSSFISAGGQALPGQYNKCITDTLFQGLQLSGSYFLTLRQDDIIYYRISLKNNDFCIN